jgi:acyl carrier protein
MNIDKKVRDIIEQYITTDIGISDVNVDTSFKNDLGIDSISIIQILILLEDIFSIVFEEEEINGLREYGKLIDCINEKLRS